MVPLFTKESDANYVSSANISFALLKNTVSPSSFSSHLLFSTQNKRYRKQTTASLASSQCC
uniref:Uncharacterized protein n=1 Tax=Saimiri boliviensis boliviensis TaxID=39432 RepID=A0A2K6SDF6_SAIBB